MLNTMIPQRIEFFNINIKKISTDREEPTGAENSESVEDCNLCFLVEKMNFVGIDSKLDYVLNSYC